MEKQSSISSSKFIGSTLENIILNSSLNLSKMREVMNALDRAAKAIIVPVLKIQKKISIKFENFAKDYNEIKSKAETVNKEIVAHQDGNKTDFMNITDIQLNQKYANNHENMILFYQHIANNIDLFTKLINSEEYDQLIKGFDSLISDKEIFEEKEIEKEEEKVEEKLEIEKLEKENIKIKKPKKQLNPNKNLKKKSKKMTNIKSKDKKQNKASKKKKKEKKDLLELLQTEYPTNPYVKKVSKTFLSRRLNKTVIYRHNFEYNIDGSFTENKLRSAGESTVYKYGKATFKFLNDEIKNTDKIDEMLGKELKQQFAKIDNENHEYIIAGKIGCSAVELIEKIFKQNLLKELSVNKAILEFYEFYEELVSEFNEKESNVRIIFCDEKVLKHLREDWLNLELVRNFIKQKKSETG